MRNLTGKSEQVWESTIVHELSLVGISIVFRREPVTDLPTGIGGHLGPIAFLRAARCWIAQGPVPLEIAEQLHCDNAGRDIQIYGIESEPPCPPWIAWHLPNGRRIPSMSEDAYQYARQLWPISAAASEPLEFQDDPQAAGAKGYIELYHLFSYAALRTFTQTLRRGKLNKDPCDWWWQRRARWLQGEQYAPGVPPARTDFGDDDPALCSLTEEELDHGNN